MQFLLLIICHMEKIASGSRMCFFMSIVFVCAAVLRIVYATYSRLCRKYPLSAP